MADRLISADVLKSKVLQGQFIIGQDGTWYVLGLIDSLPTIEAEPVKHGRWVEDEYGIPHCSECKAINNTVYRNYCPNCGARMGEVEE